MKHDLLATVMQLLDEVSREKNTAFDEIWQQLKDSGFKHSDLRQAIDWLQALSTHTQSAYDKQVPRTARIFGFDERSRIGKKGLNFLLYLENIGVVDSQAREHIIERLMELDSKDITSSQVRWATMTVLAQNANDLTHLSWLKAVVSDPNSPEICH